LPVYSILIAPTSGVLTGAISRLLFGAKAALQAMHNCFQRVHPVCI